MLIGSHICRKFGRARSEEHTSELQSRFDLVCRLLLEKKKIAEREELLGKVQIIYIEPHYSIQFRSNWQTSARSSDLNDGRLEDLSQEVDKLLTVEITC